MRYDADRDVDAEKWSELDESERIAVVRDYHRRARIEVPNINMHASLHVVVESQILLGEETPVAATFKRLLTEGLDRHDAIHAIAAEMAVVMFDAVKNPDGGDLSAAYFKAVSRLTAKSWRAQAE